MKKFLIILLIALVALASGYFLFSKGGITFTKETSAYKAIPLDAPLFLELNSINAIPLQNPILQELKNAGIINNFYEKIHLIDTLISGTKDISNSLKNDKVILVLTLEGRENIVPLFILSAESNSKKNNLIKLASQLFPENNYNFTKREYNGNKIFSLTSKTSINSFHYSFANGLLIASPKAILVEEAIRQLDSESILSDENFVLVNKTVAQQSKASVYINHKHFPLLFQKWLNPETSIRNDEFGIEKKTRYKIETQRFSNYAAWSELDFSSKDNEFRLNGITLADDSLFNFLSIFAGQEPVKYQIDKVLPKRTALFVDFAFSNKDLFLKKLEDFFIHSEFYYSREETFKKIQSRSGSNLKQIFIDNLENEVGLAFYDVPVDPMNKNTVFIISTKGHSQAKEAFVNFLKKYATNNKVDYNSMVASYQVDKETDYLIYTFPFPSFPGTWLRGPFISVSANYFTFWDNYIIFCNSKPALQNHLHDLVLDASLAKDVDYLKYKQNLDSKVNINFYLDVNSGLPLSNAYLSKEVSKNIKLKEENLIKFGAFSWQVINTNDLFFNNLYLNYLNEIKEDAKTTWQSNIGSKISMKPQLVYIHDDPKNREIIVQDDQYRLHQITKEGRIRWEIKIPEKIIGEIHQIDFLKNGKYQYLFNTKEKLYLIDRNGNNVSPFPINLRAEATNGVSVFDYDNNRNYRYFLAGIDKKIYVYDTEGKIVSGWKFGQTDHQVNLPVQHYRVGGKDYIVFKDKSKIYMQDRQGATRIKVPVNFENSENPLLLNTVGTPKIIATDKNGVVYYIYFNGRHVQKKTPKFGEGHLFTADDLDGNGIVDFIFVDKNELNVINENGKKLFSKKFNHTVSFNPNIYNFSSSLKKIGIVIAEENRIYLYNPDGSLHQGFPLLGNSEFTIGKISDNSNYFNLLVGSEDGNIYNYSLN